MKGKVFILLSFAAVIGILFGGGCTYKTRLADFTILSTKVTKLNVKKGERVKEEACNINILGLITLRSDAQNIEEPIDKILHKEKSNLFLVDGVIYRKDIFTYLFNSFCFEVEGNVATFETGK